MRFTASTIAAAAVIFASVQAAPHGGGHHHGGNSTGEGFGQGSAQESGRGGRGGGRGGRPSGGFSGTGVASFPSATAPAQLPSGTGGLSVPDLSSISFEFPSSAIGAANVKAADDDDDDEDEDSTKTKKSSKTKTSAAAEASATGSDGDDEAATTSAASAEPTGSDDEESAASTAATPVATGGSGSTNGSSTYAPAASAAASTTFPTAAGESTLSEPMVVTGEFDGGLVRFGRGVECGGQSEGGDSDAVFQVEEGGTLKNVIIGADQGEGVHCMGACTIENVWWEAVCEDALTIKQESGVSYVIGGGAKGASDKVIQHNGGGTVNVQGFYATDFGKLYRSCGNCDTMYERHIIMDGVVADGGSATLVGINTNYGDTATITNSCITNTDPICTEFEGNDTGDEPTEVSTGISASCIYTDADVTTC